MTCLHGGTCQAQGTRGVCQCPPGYSGAHCEDSEYLLINERELLFSVDTYKPKEALILDAFTIWAIHVQISRKSATVWSAP